ncbi:hypothetical protein [Sinorhizobium fredii]|uniref:hypothetical protein n=1 Tax=Rhizobium fredii TaxID=380 RepID=UPI00351354A7
MCRHSHRLPLPALGTDRLVVFDLVDEVGALRFLSSVLLGEDQDPVVQLPFAPILGRKLFPLPGLLPFVALGIVDVLVDLTGAVVQVG